MDPVKLPSSLLVGTDFSPCSEKALAWAVAVAERLGAKLTLLHVMAPPPALGGALPEAAVYEAAEWSNLLREQRDLMDGALEDAARKYHGRVEIDLRLEEGHPVETLAAVAEELDSDLVVVGSHGRTGLQRLVTGSVAERVVRHVPRAVTVIH